MEHQKQQFEELIGQYKSLIYKFCYMYANDLDTPADLFQEVVINLWKGYPRFRGDSSIQTWIYRIALNTCVTFLRKSGSRPPTTALTDDLPVYAELPDTDRIKELYQMINRLNAIEKAIILLYLEERPYEEIALITGLTKNNVGVRLTRIKEKLSQMYSH